MRRVDFSKTKITGGFWAQKQELVKNETVWAVYKRFVETGRFDVFDFESRPFVSFIKPIFA